MGEWSINKGAYFSGLGVTISDYSSEYLTWDYYLTGDAALLDIVTDPAHPIVADSGLYTVIITALTYTPMTLGRTFRTRLVLAESGYSVQFYASSAGQPSGGTYLYCQVAATGFIPAGDTIAIQVDNLDGTIASNDFQIDAASVLRVG